MSNNGKDKPSQKYQPTSAKAWRKSREEGYVVPLPSGNQARLRPISLDMLIVTGKIPDLLTPVAARSVWAETETSELVEKADLSIKYLELINLIVPLAMMEPKVVENPEADGEISLEDIDFLDKIAIFNLATQPADFLRSFRDQQAERMASASNSENIRPEAEQPS